jgi:hypothetical protein
MTRLKALSRHVVGNRRRHRRIRHAYDTTLLGETNKALFRGKTINLSRSGAKIAGLPVGVGVVLGQWVRVEFLILPKDPAQVVKRMTVCGHVWRIEELLDQFNVAVRFTRSLNV